MTLQEFEENYYLHDSFIEKLNYNKENATLTLQINFAFWMQKNYIEGTPENGLIKVVFYNVSEYNCENGDPTGDFVGILNAKLENGSFIINLLDDETENFIVLRISALSVEVTRL